MSINAQVFSYSYDDQRAQCQGHDPVIQSGQIPADSGSWPVGLLMTRKSDNSLIECKEIAAEVLGAGDGATKAFSGTLANAPLQPGSVVVTDGVEIFTDDGCGNLTGDAGGTGTVNYLTGAVSVSFNANVGDTVDVEVDYRMRIDGVLDEAVDTTKATAGNYVAHGTVRADALKVGVSAQAAPSEAMLFDLHNKGIFPK